MAKVKLYGIQSLDFETEKGDTIQGVNLFITYPDENVYGEKADKKFISKASMKNLGIDINEYLPYVGGEIEIETNIKGKLTGLNPITTPAEKNKVS